MKRSFYLLAGISLLLTLLSGCASSDIKTMDGAVPVDDVIVPTAIPAETLAPSL